MTVTCVCHSDRRHLLLVGPMFDGRPNDFTRALAELGWEPRAEVNGYVAPLGGQARFRSVAEITDFLGGLFGEQLREVRGVWMDPNRSPAEQCDELLRAQPLEQLAGGTSLELAETIARKRLETWFQPILTSELDRVWGYECLVRGREAAGGLVGAGPLLDAARREHLVFSFDRTCRELHVGSAAASGAPPDTRFLINFLPTVIYDPHLCLKSTFAAVRRTRLRPEQIIFEVVESEAIRDHGHLRHIVDVYRTAGFGVALDDLGAGHSGLNLLADLEPDLIKVDRALVSQCESSSIHQSVCRMVVELGREQGKRVLAEGVETPGQLAFLRGIGVDLFQGYLLGRPAPEILDGAALAELRARLD